ARTRANAPCGSRSRRSSGKGAKPMWAGDPIDYSGPHLSDPNAIIPLLAAMARMKVDDVFITTDNPVQIEHLGEMRSVTRYTLNGSQVERILKKITGQDAV